MTEVLKYVCLVTLVKFASEKFLMTRSQIEQLRASPMLSVVSTRTLQHLASLIRNIQQLNNCKLVGRQVYPFIGHEDPQGEQRYSSTLFLTSALEGGEGSASRPGRTLPPGKTRYPFYRRLGGPQGRSGQVRKISPPPGFDPRIIQPVGSRQTDYATRPFYFNVNFNIVFKTVTCALVGE